MAELVPKRKPMSRPQRPHAPLCPTAVTWDSSCAASRRSILSHPSTPPSWGVLSEAGTTRIGVWVPSAAHVTLVTAEDRHVPLAATPDGWHSAETGHLPPGTRYGFMVGGRLVPDPASRCQPDGPDLWSVVTEPGTYLWSDAAWHGRPWPETVLYELHVGTFSKAGTFLGAIEHLDHLARLGVTMIELMPVGTFYGDRNWGYDGVLPYAPARAYGTPDDLKRLVDACHARGISIILDVVYNHFGPASNWLHGYAPEFFTDRHHTPWGMAIDFDGPHARPVREFFIQNATYWITEFHLDGLRLDAVQAVFDDGDDHVLDELARRVRAAAPGRAVHLILENDNNDVRWLTPQPGRAPNYDAQWNDDFHHVMRVLVTGRRDGYYVDYADNPLQRLGTALTEGFSYQGGPSTHRPGLFRGTPSAGLPPTAFVSFLQNHDQVGNTPFGKRLDALAPPAALRLATAVMCLAPAIPMLFMGQEWASARPFDFFCDFDPHLGSLVRNGRREEFSHLPEFSDPAMLAQLLDPNAPGTRDASTLDWDAVHAPGHAEWLAFHRTVLAIRRERIVPLLAHIGGNSGTFRTFGADQAEGGAIEASWRLDDGRSLSMTANFSAAAVECPPPPGELLFELEGQAGAQLAAWGLRVALRPA